MNAHGSSTPLNDRIETHAIKEVFGERARRVPVSGTKGMHAHALGASGAMEAAIAALSIAEGYVPSTANLTNPDPECDLDYVPGSGRDATVRTVLSNTSDSAARTRAWFSGRRSEDEAGVRCRRAAPHRHRVRTPGARTPSRPPP